MSKALTVGELIKVLSVFPDDWMVYNSHGSTGFAGVAKVEANHVWLDNTDNLVFPDVDNIFFPEAISVLIHTKDYNEITEEDSTAIKVFLRSASLGQISALAKHFPQEYTEWYIETGQEGCP